MVFGFQLSIARVGSSVNFMVLSPLYNFIEDSFNAPAYSALGWTLMISGSTCVMSFICSVILGWMDKRADKILKKSNHSSNIKMTNCIGKIKCFRSFLFLHLFAKKFRPPPLNGFF